MYTFMGLGFRSTANFSLSSMILFDSIGVMRRVCGACPAQQLATYVDSKLYLMGSRNVFPSSFCYNPRHTVASGSQGQEKAAACMSSGLHDHYI